VRLLRQFAPFLFRLNRQYPSIRVLVHRLLFPVTNRPNARLKNSVDPVRGDGGEVAAVKPNTYRVVVLGLLADSARRRIQNAKRAAAAAAAAAATKSAQTGDARSTVFGKS